MTMTLALPLLLAHFLADYPLQSHKLVHYKSRHAFGILLHSLVHFSLSVLLVAPFLHLPKVWWGIIVIFATHNLFDQTKVTLTKKTGLNHFGLYVIDQASHWAVIGAMAVWIGAVTPFSSAKWTAAFTNSSLFSFLLTLTLTTYFYDVSRWMYLNAKNPRPYQRNYRMMARNALIVVIAFAVYWLT